MKNFREEAQALGEEIIAMRRALHEHPEISSQETWTTEFIAQELRRLGLTVLPWQGETGVVALLHGKKEGPCIALRADIDALPVQEKTGLPYASKIPGVMHACGHDAHTASLLGAARILAENRDSLNGTVKFIFQPAEEVSTGAASMISLGVLENPTVEFIYGQHNQPEAPTGTLLLSSGPIMACMGLTKITVRGKGGHGGIPHETRDPVVAAAAIIMSLQTIISRETDPFQPVVITTGSIHAGTAGNVIPDSVEMQGTIRTFDLRLFDELEDRMRRIITDTAHAYRCEAEFTYVKSAPYVYNPEDLTEWLTSGPLAKVFGPQNIKPLRPKPGAEDFAHYQAKVPGVFAWYGSGNETINLPWHNPGFTVDESSLILAAAAYAQVAHDWLEKNG